jgi:hypothetical protein
MEVGIMTDWLRAVGIQFDSPSQFIADAGIGDYWPRRDNIPNLKRLCVACTENTATTNDHCSVCWFKRSRRLVGSKRALDA